MKIPMAKPIFNEEMKEAALSALENEWFVLGESVKKFEEEFAKYCGAKQAISVSSGTNALQMALLATGVKPQDEVVTSPASFIASANVAIHVNAVPKFADIDVKTYNVDPVLLEKAVNEKTSCLLPVYLYGRPADMDPIMDIGETRDLSVIADAAQAHGAKYKGIKIGTLADLCCFSFYSSKCMTVCGDGGMVVTNDEDKANIVAKLRDCGRVTRYEHDAIGYTSRLNNVNAAIGRVQLKYLDEWNESRRKNVSRYNRFLKDVGDLILPPKDDSDYESAYYLYVIRTSKRDELKDWLTNNGIQTGIHYPIPIHLQPIYKQMYGYEEGDYPKSEVLSKTVLSLPMFQQLTPSEIDYVCEKITEFYNK
ncbi:MAG: DegT/DnrJ/EryC1/StrS family aminotransferase [Candidatus Hodarchaeota archaeon]